MTDFVFERGLFATLAAALIVPELTTFLIFVFVTVSLSSLLARLAWSFVRVPHSEPTRLHVPDGSSPLAD
jgi:hypothetical protein